MCLKFISKRPPHVRVCKGRILGFWIPRHGFRIPGTLSAERGFRIPISNGIPDSLSCIPDFKAQDFGFQKQKFPGFHSATGFAKPLVKETNNTERNSAMFPYFGNKRPTLTIHYQRNSFRQNRYLSVVIKYTFFGALWRGMLLKRGTGNGERRTSAGNGKIKKWEQNRELPMKLLIGLGFKISFSPFFITSFHELVLGPRCPVPRFNNCSREEKKNSRKTIRSFIAFTYSLLK